MAKTTGKNVEPKNDSPPTEPPVLDFTSPNGVPDWRLPEREAELWLLSATARRAGSKVEYNTETNRWQPVSGVTVAVRLVTCVCGRAFEVARSTAKFCSTTCRTKAHKRALER